ncbi:hypothetical protein I3843_07G217200 [Carya illinoinensis]|nr:hypothetical protein I3843_07G217200 [Carya illinoinensis]
MSLVAELPGYLQVMSDGSVKRFAHEIVPASSESINGYKSKDVIIDTSKPITGRLFLPGTLGVGSSDHKLPVIVHFHGGGFCIGSTTWVGTHTFLGGDSAGGNIVHNVAIKAIQNNNCPVKIKGLLPIHPYFGSEQKTEKEKSEGASRDFANIDLC